VLPLPSPPASGSPDSTTPARAHRRLLALALLLPLAIIVGRYRSLWYDEAALGANIVTRSFAELFQPLAYLQVAPIGYLLLAKASNTLLGFNDLAIRLPSLVAYLCLFGLLARRATGGWASVLRLALVAGAPGVIRYGFELKPYIYDVLLMVLLLEHAEAIFARAPRALLFSALAVSLANASFIQVPLFALLVAVRQVRSAGTPIGGVAVRLLAAAAPLGAYYLAFVAHHPAHHRMDELWTQYFIFSPAQHQNPLVFVLRRLRALVHLAYINRGAQALWAAYLVGLVAYLQERRVAALAATTLPILAHLGLSALNLYPFDGGRLTLYLIVPVAYAGADGLAALLAAWSARVSTARQAGLARLAGLGALALVAGNAIAYAVMATEKEDIRPLFTALRSRPPAYQASVPLHFLPMSDKAFEYYADQARAAGRPFLGGYPTISHDDSWEPFLQDALTHERVALVFSHSAEIFGVRRLTAPRAREVVSRKLRERDPAGARGLRISRMIWANGSGLVEVESRRRDTPPPVNSRPRGASTILGRIPPAGSGADRAPFTATDP
jgi:hypothetical protein